jgi:hypothetical protein
MSHFQFSSEPFQAASHASFLSKRCNTDAATACKFAWGPLGERHRTSLIAPDTYDRKRCARALMGSRVWAVTRVRPLWRSPPFPAHGRPLVHPQSAAREGARRWPHQTYRNSGRTLRAPAIDRLRSHICCWRSPGGAIRRRSRPSRGT